jgi:hypothetical protein
MIKQQALSVFLQGTGYAAGAGANGNGVIGETSGITGTIMMEVVENGGGTATLNIEGAMDQTFTNNYIVGYQRVDGQAALTRAAAALSVTAALKGVYQILDPYPFIRARISAIAGGAAIIVRLYAVPM